MESIHVVTVSQNMNALKSPIWILLMQVYRDLSGLVGMVLVLSLSGCQSSNSNAQRYPSQYRAQSQQATVVKPTIPVPSEHQQVLAAIQRSRLRRRPILNKSEDKIYWALWRLLKNSGLAQKLRILPQVNLGSAMADSTLSEPDADNRAYNSIRCKRADFCIVDQQWLPIAFVEFQGKGHYGQHFTANMDTLERDSTKQAACAKAGVLYYAIPARALTSIEQHLETGFLPLLKDFLNQPSTPHNTN